MLRLLAVVLWLVSLVAGSGSYNRSTQHPFLLIWLGDAIVSLGTIPALFDDQGSCDNKRCSDYSFELIVDARDRKRSNLLDYA